jgi:transposase-like protein
MTSKSSITPELLDQLLANYEKPEDLTGDDGLFKQLKKALIERALGAELTEHLGYEKGDPAGRGSGNNRNGYSTKTVLGDDGAIEIAVPRDRQGSFEPQIVPKGQTRLDGFDDRIISLYARGLSVREIQAHLQELYGVEVSPDLISRVTDAVLEAEARAGKAGRLADQLVRVDLVILDELGYLPFAQTGGQLLFHLHSAGLNRPNLTY